MLEIRYMKTGYGKKQIINNVSLKVPDEQIIALIGHNGAGKSTILKSIIGIIPIWSGEIIFNGELLKSSANENVKRGICMIPQGSDVFDDLTVFENLEIASFILNNKETIRERFNEVFYQFPVLKENRKKPAGKLSGGEQQMLALGMALMQRPKLLLLDEPSLGLSPSFVKKAFKVIKDLNKKYNMSILIVEQKVKEVLEMADYAYVLRLGKVALEDNAKELKKSEAYKEVFLT